MKKKLLFMALVVCTIISTSVFAQNTVEYRNIKIINYDVNEVSVRTINSQGTIYISIDDVLKATGFQLGWESAHGGAVIVYNPVICDNMYVYINQNKIWDGQTYIHYNTPVLVHEQCAYITEKMLKDLTWQNYTFELNLTVLDYDKYRRLGNVDTYNGINLLNRYYAFETVNITDQMAKEYADAVSAIAKTLPENVNVYNMAIPNSGEYYAPKSYTANLRDVYQQIYMNLDTRVTPVDIYDILFEHADEPIFFNTDHHWTQRGAYYAFLQFMKMQGVSLNTNYLEAFETKHSNTMVGSFSSLMKGTAGAVYLRSNPELFERFIPPYTITKEVYDDCKLEKFVADGPLINYMLDEYSTFLGGDVPVMKLHNEQINDGSTLCILKESYANAFAIWAACNYEYVYLVDIRCFNGANGHTEPFDMKTFYDVTNFDDLLIMSYPNTIADKVLRDYIKKFSGYKEESEIVNDTYILQDSYIYQQDDNTLQNNYNYFKEPDIWKDSYTFPQDMNEWHDLPVFPSLENDLWQFMPVYSEETGMWH